MKTFRLSVSFHHNSDRDPYSQLLELDEVTAQLADQDVEAVMVALEIETSIGYSEVCDKPLEDPRPAIAAAIAEAKKTGESQKFVVKFEGEDRDFTIWHKDGGKNFGFGEGEARDKYENFWLALTEFKPDQKLRERLEAMPKQHLIELVEKLLFKHDDVP